ncbi:MAG: hypothetical protein HY320_00765 [Armatimonadetes bacterium]|nr:hypothetical protein [Armatimonadota bacterium]
MSPRAVWLLLSGLLAVSAGAALGQESPPPRTAARVTRAARELADDIAIARVLTAARLNREQLERLLPVLAKGFEQLDAGDQAAAAEIARLKEALATAKKALLTGQPPGQQSEVEANYTATVLRLADQREQSRRGLRNRVRALLLELIPEEERADLLNAARPAVAARRLGGLEPPAGPFWATPAAGGSEGFLGSLAGRMRTLGRLRDLERLRAANSPEEYERLRLRFALSAAGIPGRAAVRGRDGRPVEIQAPNLNDPAVQARLQPFMALADGARVLSPQQYEQQQDALAAQLDALEQQQRREREMQREISAEEAADAFVDVYLMNPRSVTVIKARLGKE